jgi:hypothetical protein
MLNDTEWCIIVYNYVGWCIMMSNDIWWCLIRYMKGYTMCVFSILVYIGNGIITAFGSKIR